MTEEQKSLLNGFKHLRKLEDYDYDFKLAKERGICSRDDGPDLGYLELQGKYDRALSLYLEQTLDMQSLDAELEVRGIPGYDVRPDDPADTMWEWFRSRSHLDSPYLYLRSNLRIERLSEEDIEALRTESLDTDEGRQALTALAARTYQELTRYEGEHGSWAFEGGIHTVLSATSVATIPLIPATTPLRPRASSCGSPFGMKHCMKRRMVKTMGSTTGTWTGASTSRMRSFLSTRGGSPTHLATTCASSCMTTPWPRRKTTSSRGSLPATSDARAGTEGPHGRGDHTHQ